MKGVEVGDGYMPPKYLVYRYCHRKYKELLKTEE